MEISLLLGVLVGAVLGLTGAGGGILAVPALIVGMGWTMQHAAPVALIAVAGSAAIGALDGLRKGLVRYKAAAVMVLAGLPFTSIGIRVASGLPQAWLLGLFAGVLLIVATRLLRQSRSAEICKDKAWAHLDAVSGRFHWTWSIAMLFASIGAFTGFMTGLLGVGGGFVIVPALRRFTDLTMHGIVATSLMVIALVGSGGVIAAVAHGANLPLMMTALFAFATGIGMLLGRKLAARLVERHIQIGFSMVLIVVALGMSLKAFVTL